MTLAEELINLHLANDRVNQDYLHEEVTWKPIKDGYNLKGGPVQAKLRKWWILTVPGKGDHVLGPKASFTKAEHLIRVLTS